MPSATMPARGCSRGAAMTIQEMSSRRCPSKRSARTTRQHYASASRAKRKRMIRDRSAQIAHPEKPSRIKADVTVSRGAMSAANVTAYIAAISLAGAAAWFSIRGMVVLFPGSPMSVIGMSVAMESAKLVTAGWLARRWRATAWVWRAVLVALVAGLAVINATGVYAQLVAAHVGDRGVAMSAIETQDAALGARIEVAAHVVDDLDRRLDQIDTAIETAAKRGKTGIALSAIESQRKARMALAGERNREADTLAALKAERASVAAQGRRIETEAAPIRYVAELLGSTPTAKRPSVALSRSWSCAATRWQ
jgi:hypothetical protein